MQPWSECGVVMEYPIEYSGNSKADHQLLTHYVSYPVVSVRITPEAAVGRSMPFIHVTNDPEQDAKKAVSSWMGVAYLQSHHMDIGYELNCAPSVGTLSAFMIFVDFPDRGATGGSPRVLYDFFLPAAEGWYSAASYGAMNLSVTADTSRFYRMPATATSYKWERGLTAGAHKQYIQDALAAYDAPISPKDVLYIVPTANATAITYSPTFMGNVTTRNGTYVAKKSVTFRFDGYNTWGFLVLNHETGHTMCLPDYYLFNSSVIGLYIGGWDLIGLIGGPSPDYFAWDKWRLGWLDDDQVDCVTETGVTTHILSPLESSGGKKAVVIKRSETEVLVAEVRSTLGLDAASCTSGVLLYTISTTTATGEGPVESSM